MLVEALATNNDSGLGRIARIYIEALESMSSGFDVKIIIKASGTFRPKWPASLIRVNPWPMRLWIRVFFPLLLWRLRPQVVLCLGQTIPAFGPPCKYILFIPDIGPLENLPWSASKYDAFNRTWIRIQSQRADAILTCSGFTKNRMMELLQLPAHRVNVVKPISASYLNDSSSPLSKDPPAPFFLSVGNLEPRKNYPTLILAYAMARKNSENLPPLYIVGHKAWGADKVFATIAEHGLENVVKTVGYVDDRSLQDYFCHCSLYISSSLYEGWGFPLFEALVKGRPAIYHYRSSQSEFAQGFAKAVDCQNPSELATAIEGLWNSPTARHVLTKALEDEFLALNRAYNLPECLKEGIELCLALPRRWEKRSGKDRTESR